jgi:hypothetical protein
MFKIFLGTLTVAGLIVGTATMASASPATRLLDRTTTAGTASVEHVDYSWNRRKYRHRSWDKRHRRWRYYN